MCTYRRYNLVIPKPFSPNMRVQELLHRIEYKRDLTNFNQQNEIIIMNIIFELIKMKA